MTGTIFFQIISVATDEVGKHKNEGPQNFRSAFQVFSVSLASVMRQSRVSQSALREQMSI